MSRQFCHCSGSPALALLAILHDDPCALGAPRRVRKSHAAVLRQVFHDYIDIHRAGAVPREQFSALLTAYGRDSEAADNSCHVATESGKLGVSAAPV